MSHRYWQFLSGTALVTGSAVEWLQRMPTTTPGRCRRFGADDIDRLATGDKGLFKDNPEQSIFFSTGHSGQHIKRGGNPLSGEVLIRDIPGQTAIPVSPREKGLFTGAYGFAAQAAEVEVDTLTGRLHC